MNKLPFIAKAVIITPSDNPLATTPCQVYRVARPSGAGILTLRDGGPTGQILFKDYLGVAGSGPIAFPGVDFNSTPLDFPTGVFVDGTSFGEVVLYLGPEG